MTLADYHSVRTWDVHQLGLWYRRAVGLHLPTSKLERILAYATSKQPPQPAEDPSHEPCEPGCNLRGSDTAIALRRRELGLTASEASARAGVSEASWRKWELGRITKLVDVHDTAASIAGVLGVEAAFVLEYGLAPVEGAGFPGWLKEQMRMHGLTGSAVADLLGVSESSVSLWRSGKLKPSSDRLPGLAEVFGVDPVDLPAI